MLYLAATLFGLAVCVLDTTNDDIKDQISSTVVIESVLAILNDQPYRPENHPFLGIRWQAVTVPVCMDTDNEGGQHGFLAWSWTVTRQGTVEKVQYKMAKASLENDIKEALDKWNGQHEAWGTIKHPVLPTLTTN